MSKIKETLQTKLASATQLAPSVFGEVFDDGQMRGEYGVDNVPQHAIVFGKYILWDSTDGKFGIGYRETGEMGIFNKADFEAHIEAFYGLNF